MLFLWRRASSASWWGKQCAERQPFRETADHRWANLGESEGNVKGRPPVPMFPPNPRAPASEVAIHSVSMYLSPPAMM